MNAMMTKTLGKVSLFWKSHGSTVCLVTGMAGAVGAGVLGAKGWHEAKLIIDHKTEELERVNQAAANHDSITVDGVTREYTEEDKQKDIATLQKTTVVGVAKALAPAVGLGVASLTLIACGYRSVQSQLAGATAYASSLEAIIAQRDKIFRKELGDEKVDMLYAGYRTETKEVVTEDPKTGEKTVTLEEVLVKELDVPADGIFRFKYGRGCSGWRAGCREMNMMQVNIAQSNLTDLLCARRFVLVEDICDALGLPPEARSGAGQVCGKVYDANKLPEENRIILKVDPFEDPNSDEITLTFESAGYILSQIGTARKEHHPLKRKYA